MIAREQRPVKVTFREGFRGQYSPLTFLLVRSREGLKDWLPDIFAQVSLQGCFSGRSNLQYGKSEIAAPLRGLQ